MEGETVSEKEREIDQVAKLARVAWARYKHEQGPFPERPDVFLAAVWGDLYKHLPGRPDDVFLAVATEPPVDVPIDPFDLIALAMKWAVTIENLKLVELLEERKKRAADQC